MKNLIVTMLVLVLSNSAHALSCGETESTTSSQETKVEVVTNMPKHLKGATIILKKADGSEEVLKAEEYMVVKRKHSRPVIKETTKETSLACKIETKNVALKNIVSLKAVDGNSDVKKEQPNSKTLSLKVERQVGAGLQYQRAITDRIYLGCEVDTNQGVGVLLGIGF